MGRRSYEDREEADEAPETPKVPKEPSGFDLIRREDTRKKMEKVYEEISRSYADDQKRMKFDKRRNRNASRD